LENWYLSKLNEATVNKSHDDILIEYLKNISRKLIPTKINESTLIGFTIINDALLHTLYAYICTYWNVHE
jgi:hypothetical protein